MSFATRLYTMRNGELVGEDAFGNRYYQEKRSALGREGLYRRKRWVFYKGKAEGSKVPAEWHAWLHHTSDAPLATPAAEWAQPHQPNLTGTLGAYVPDGDERAGGRRAAATGDYQPWRP
ncbi:NADH:ubiquinone oxidoreductase subunit NDUFA12 [Rhodospirillum rubrum]|uniref:NADH:ubiquinone oxidoreductase 17.2 kD subunit n=1 Tax=Rhodospirillum rubrum (strain ATCC 11170 / ATH 1.1.1 / DSM 467 / LMG 4362 / NCIMB 8255 / S1) TaxID=269796 RepID=Q2RRK5_RHORT|nr:NADH:ubiquinone oxidoreductase subunit NDUFA12 [Rhodospirillum rubrum]ABC23240.1 NADH:ubiquinone oxidoreductase 17.2 kD subunit [Rhodospirillum rubrum ATCC 11170]AEO48971.1 NADH dehydrogenase [Rhodospirillum rubrum F11]MBK5954874.1 NADH:ubiquinone oxidoreductase subunit NDUFA12 [Rhodospirillum rubrum]QXG79215.1 NADH:ubiquinone oxidoreductase subunit NDUFA12 [Rhodospirillum rubrum]HAP98854.1 NADH:ubiquinone oxidoreductase subunit NDUFA12 [Rhodospirillum rubrum]